MSIELKIKQASLAEEIRIIRNVERKLTKRSHQADALKKEMRAKMKKGQLDKLKAEELYGPKIAALRAKVKKRLTFNTFETINHHRVAEVRREARHTNLAVGFLRGLDYNAVENSRYTFPVWSEVERMVIKYGEGDERERKQHFEQWVQEALKQPVKNFTAGRNGPDPWNYTKK